MAAGSSPKFVTQERVQVTIGKTQQMLQLLGSMKDRSVGDSSELSQHWKYDPFRMSVLDFQRSSIDKLAEILSIYIKFVMKVEPEINLAIEKGVEDAKRRRDNRGIEEKMEDVSWLLYTIKTHFTPHLEHMRNLGSDCCDLINARNIFAHEAYIKMYCSPSSYPSSPSSKLMKGRTFQYTSETIDKCIKFAQGIQEGAIHMKMENVHELTGRVQSLETLRTTFQEFSEYRELELENLHKYFSKKESEKKKKTSLEVLELMRKRIEAEDEDLQEIVSCVFATRCCIELK